MKYRAFISYRHLEPDRTVAVSVHRLLEKYTVPSRLRRNGEKHLGRIFRDEDELPLSVSLSDSILAALEESEFLIVIRQSLFPVRGTALGNVRPGIGFPAGSGSPVPGSGYPDRDRRRECLPSRSAYRGNSVADGQ